MGKIFKKFNEAWPWICASVCCMAGMWAFIVGHKTNPLEFGTWMGVCACVGFLWNKE